MAEAEEGDGKDDDDDDDENAKEERREKITAACGGASDGLLASLSLSLSFSLSQPVIPSLSISLVFHPARTTSFKCSGERAPPPPDIN